MKKEKCSAPDAKVAKVKKLKIKISFPETKTVFMRIECDGETIEYTEAAAAILLIKLDGACRSTAFTALFLPSLVQIKNKLQEAINRRFGIGYVRKEAK